MHSLDFQCFLSVKRELHSGIVAAFRCLSKWLHLHDELLQDPSFLYYLMEILELGISGSKSRQNNGIDINKNNKGNIQYNYSRRISYTV